MKPDYPIEHEVNKDPTFGEWIAPICADGHHGNSGPYCDECQGAEIDAFKRIVALRELDTEAPDFTVKVIALLKEPLF